MYCSLLVTHSLTKCQIWKKNLDIHKHIEQKKKKKVCTTVMVYNNERNNTHK